MRLIDLSNIKTYPLSRRHNLVHLDDLLTTDHVPPPFDSPELDAVVAQIIAARRAGRPVIWMMGGHVIKSGLSRLLIDLMRRGIVTHVAGNGAVSIHDIELALIGETSEDVAASLEDGTFGMADETGRLMNRAIQEGVRDGLGYGASIGRFIAEHAELFPFRDVNVLYQAHTLGIPATIHATIGTDIIHQHPTVDFGALGMASGLDFRAFAASVSELEGGVFLNFGSAVTGPEVFLKALTVVRNLGHTTAHITTANFDLLSLGEDYHGKVGYDNPTYYYRPRKNIINRPTSLGGHGYHITGDHAVTIPNLHHRVTSVLDTVEIQTPSTPPLTVQEHAVMAELTARQPVLEAVVPDLIRAFHELSRCFKTGGVLFLCGNGGSMADALHISGELLKSYARRRWLPDRLVSRLAGQPDGECLARNLEPGLRVVVLGANPSLASAVANDMPDRDVNLAQELLALAHPGDVFLGISTSGNARNVNYAAQVARALNLPVIALTGKEGGHLASLADVAIRAPAQRTDRVQELHILCYHALCELLENTFFADEDAAGVE
jgi:phosphoheptose isomerase